MKTNLLSSTAIRHIVYSLAVPMLSVVVKNCHPAEIRSRCRRNRREVPSQVSKAKLEFWINKLDYSSIHSYTAEVAHENEGYTKPDKVNGSVNP